MTLNRCKRATSKCFTKSEFSQNIYERQNAIATGGGTAPPKPKEVKIEVTGPLLEVMQHFGNLITGLPAFDSDNHQSVYEQEELVFDESHLTEETTAQVDFEPIQRNVWSNARSETVVSLMDISISGTPNASVATAALPISGAPNASVATAAIPVQNQFFATSDQRRRRVNATNSQISAERHQFIEEERERARELHGLKKNALCSENELRLASMRAQNEIKILEIRRRNELRGKIYAKQEQFWDTLNAMVRNGLVRPAAARPQTIEVDQMHADQMHASTVALEIGQIANLEMSQNATEVEEEFEQHVQEIAIAANDSSDSISSNYDDPNDRDYEDYELYDE